MGDNDLAALDKIAQQYPAHRLPPPSGYIERLNPDLAGALASRGYDPETVRQQYNESTRRRQEAATAAQQPGGSEGS